MPHIKYVTSVVKGLFKTKNKPLKSTVNSIFRYFSCTRAEWRRRTLHSQRSLGDSWKCQRGRGEEGSSPYMGEENANGKTNHGRDKHIDKNPRVKGNIKSKEQ